ncbi:MAG TPA: ABC transporter substrate-binding protein [Stellaceae bacterium]|jgi:NitT/TauT family transport system substrate-binding protein
MRRIAPLAVAVLIAATAPPSFAATKITFMHNASASFAAMFVAKDQGILEKHELDVEFTPAQSGAVMPPALVSGSVQLAAPTATVLVQAHEQGIDLVAVANTAAYPSAADGQIVGRTGSGLKETRDLMGHKVGLPSLGGIFEVLVRDWVRKAGGDDTKVQWLEVQLRQMGDALKSGLVDAAVPVEPFYSRIVQSGVGYPMGDFEAAVPAGTIPVLYATTRAWAAENREPLAELRASMAEAITFINDPSNAAAVRAAIAAHTKLPPEAAATLKIPSGLEVPVKPEGLQFWVTTMRQQGLIEHDIDPASLIAP